MSETRKYVQKQSVTDGPVTILDSDDTANHEEFWKRRLEDSSRQSVEAGLRNLPLQSLKNLAIRQRIRLSGGHKEPEVNSESREVTLNNVSRLAAARLFIAGVFPKLPRTSALFNKAVAYALMTPEEQEAYEQRHPDEFQD